MSDGLQILTAILVLVWIAIGTLALASYLRRDRSHEKPPSSCAVHGRRCPGHLHLEIMEDTVICRYPDGTITAGPKFWTEEP